MGDKSMPPPPPSSGTDPSSVQSKSSTGSLRSAGAGIRDSIRSLFGASSSQPASPTGSSDGATSPGTSDGPPTIGATSPAVSAAHKARHASKQLSIERDSPPGDAEGPGKLRKHTTARVHSPRISVARDGRVSPEGQEEEVLLRIESGVWSIQGRRPEMEDAHMIIPSMRRNTSERQDLEDDKPADGKEAKKGKSDKGKSAASSRSLTAMSGKATASEGSSRSEFLSTERRGNRRSSAPSVPPAQPPEIKHDSDVAFFGVYDGHGGTTASEWVGAHLHEYILSGRAHMTDMRKAIVDGFAKVEQEFTRLAIEHNYGDGTTATIGILQGRDLWVANVGDSEAVLCRNNKPLLMTTIHNPSKNAAEEARVTKDGGRIVAHRVGHPLFNPNMINIGVSRAIGDVMFKHQRFTQGRPSGLTAIPDIRHVELGPEDKFLILACDGLWDVMSYEEAVSLVRRQLVKNKDVTKAAEALVKQASNEGSMDNITVVVTTFKFEQVNDKNREEAMNSGWRTSLKSLKPLK